MDFISFVKTMGSDVCESCDRAALQRLGRALDRPDADLKTLLTNDDPALGGFKAESLAKLADLHRRYSKWKDAAKSLRRTLAQSKLTVPDGAYALTSAPHEIEALERTSRICPRSGHANHDQWFRGFEAYMALWRACVQLSVKEGSVTIRMTNPSHPDAAEFENCACSREPLERFPGYKWLAARRGAAAGILEISIALPMEDILAQARARLSTLGLAAEKRGAESIVEEFVTNDLESAVMQMLTDRAEDEALNSARSAYLGLLNTPPLQVATAMSVFIGRAGDPAGLAVLDRRGDIVIHKELEVGEDLGDEMKRLIAEHQPEVMVLPVTCQDTARMNVAEEAAGTVPLQRVHDIALSEARKNLSLKKAEANAIVLARRVLKPGREWGRVDPLALRLGEFIREIDPEKMLSILSEAKALSSWDRRNKNKVPSRRGKPGGKTGAVLPSGKRLNAFLRSIRDLRPGMMLDGVITNLTRFGAFVNIGLPVEGMIHVSQLSLEFVEDPSQVVRVGEQVKARVLEVVPEKQRIALSLKPAPEMGKSEGRGGGFAADPRRPNREPPKTRSAALADLDALFKK